MIYNREDMIGQNLASKEGSEKNDSEISSIPQNKTEQIFTNSEENAQLKKMLGLNITSSNEKAMNNNFQNNHSNNNKNNKNQRSFELNPDDYSIEIDEKSGYSIGDKENAEIMRIKIINLTQIFIKVS